MIDSQTIGEARVMTPCYTEYERSLVLGCQITVEIQALVTVHFDIPKARNSKHDASVWAGVEMDGNLITTVILSRPKRSLRDRLLRRAPSPTTQPLQGTIVLDLAGQSRTFALVFGALGGGTAILEPNGDDTILLRVREPRRA